MKYWINLEFLYLMSYLLSADDRNMILYIK